MDQDPPPSSFEDNNCLVVPSNSPKIRASPPPRFVGLPMPSLSLPSTHPMKSGNLQDELLETPKPPSKEALPTPGERAAALFGLRPLSPGSPMNVDPTPFDLSNLNHDAARPDRPPRTHWSGSEAAKPPPKTRFQRSWTGLGGHSNPPGTDAANHLSFSPGTTLTPDPRRRLVRTLTEPCLQTPARASARALFPPNSSITSTTPQIAGTKRPYATPCRSPPPATRLDRTSSPKATPGLRRSGDDPTSLRTSLPRVPRAPGKRTRRLMPPGIDYPSARLRAYHLSAPRPPAPRSPRPGTCASPSSEMVIENDGGIPLSKRPRRSGSETDITNMQRRWTIRSSSAGSPPSSPASPAGKQQVLSPLKMSNRFSFHPPEHPNANGSVTPPAPSISDPMDGPFRFPPPSSPLGGEPQTPCGKQAERQAARAVDSLTKSLERGLTLG